MTDAQFEEASAFLREVHKNVRLYWSDTTEIVQALSGGEVDLLGGSGRCKQEGCEKQMFDHGADIILISGMKKAASLS